MFFRIKKIKGREYVYRVENKWYTTTKSVGTLQGSDMRVSSFSELAHNSQPRGSRQKVKGYVGSAYRFDLKNNADFMQFMKIENIEMYIYNNKKNSIIRDLIEWEFFKFGINKEEFLIDMNNSTIQKKKKNVALLINDGFMCNLTLKNLLEFKPEGDEETDGYHLARAFVEGGIKIPEEIFVGLFGKLYSKPI